MISTKELKDLISILQIIPVFRELEADMKAGLSLYRQRSAVLLKKSGIQPDPPDASEFSIENNFFVYLFLYSYYRAGIDRKNRIFYTTVNQCLRGMVTGRDNILNDNNNAFDRNEFRFRSLMELMIHDRVLSETLLERCQAGKLGFNQVSAFHDACFQALARSSIRRSVSQSGLPDILYPAEVIQMVHHYKTGILFRQSWTIPEQCETVPQATTDSLKEALYQIGIGCQLMDDMADLWEDIGACRHNYVISLIAHSDNLGEKSHLQRLFQAKGKAEPVRLADFPRAARIAVRTARKHLEEGVKALLSAEHNFLADPVIGFLAERIGTSQYFDEFSDCSV